MGSEPTPTTANTTCGATWTAPRQLTIAAVTTAKTELEELLQSAAPAASAAHSRLRIDLSQTDRIDCAGCQLLYAVNRRATEIAVDLEWSDARSMLAIAARTLGMTELADAVAPPTPDRVEH